MKDSDQFIESTLNAGAFEPLSLNQPHAWVGHMPFASWLMKEISPEIFVEIGSHIGNSYFSFVQSAHENRISCKCYAVDTWKGDEHAGHYDETVFQTVNQHNSQHYQAFSQLLRMTFDEALSYFDDQSIGLLHIDGLHTYEAVRHDFESWLPKMKPGGVVVFHDTIVREKKFGVWRLWNELKEQFPNHAEFLHSHGLGVIQIGSSGARLKWLEPESMLKQWMLKYFTILGQRLMERANLQQANTDSHGQSAILNRTLAERDAQLDALSHAMEERNGQLATLNQAVEERDAKVNDLEHKMTKLRQKAEALEHIVESARQWQTRSWAKRAFHQWREPNDNRKKTKLFRRLCELIGKKKRNQFGTHVMNNMQGKSVSGSSKMNQQTLVKSIAFHKAGKPRGWVRFLFFHKNRKPRQIFKRIACKKSGAPRPVFADWMNDNEALHERACPVDKQMREIAAIFNAEAYLKLNADVHLAGVDPLTHYIKHGIEESRLINKEDIDLESITTSISVVIPTHNRADSLENTIQAVFDCGEGLNIEVVVVNDGSQDHTEEVLQRIQSNQPSLRYLTIPNQGAGVARNHGAAAAKNDIILFMGDDILPANRNFLAAHARYHQNHDKNNFAVLGKVDWPPDNIFEITPVMRHIQGPGGEQFGYADMQPHKPWDWRFFYTCNVSVKRNIVDNWLNEGFSPAFTGCCFEDAEFAYRMNKKYGIFPILYIDESVGHHYHRHTVSTFLRRQHFAGAMAKVLGDLHPDALVSVGFGPVQQAFMTKSPQSLPSIYSNLALAESIFSWAQSLEENGLLGTENWHKELLHCVFRISAFLGYIDNAGTTSSNHSSAIEYVIDLSCSPLIEALPKKYWREQGYI